ncbi:MAG TPA: hypothetical protein DCZ07_07485 [Alphaproteobacteria bacterium]|nr:hypothetical protein [Alphaproteobacteria bacterium]
MADKPELVALNKADALSPELLAEAKAALEAACGKPVMVVSGATGQGVTEVLRNLLQVIDAAARQDAPQPDEKERWQP